MVMVEEMVMMPVATTMTEVVWPAVTTNNVVVVVVVIGVVALMQPIPRTAEGHYNLVCLIWATALWEVTPVVWRVVPITAVVAVAVAVVGLPIYPVVVAVVAMHLKE